MSNKDWTEKLRDRLESHEMEAPDDLWAGIEAGLDAARQPSMGSLPTEESLQTGSRKRRAALVPLRRWGVAAAIAALAVVGWQFMKHDEMSSEPSLSSVQTIQPKVAKAADGAPPEQENTTDNTDSPLPLQAPSLRQRAGEESHSSLLAKAEPSVSDIDNTNPSVSIVTNDTDNNDVTDNADSQAPVSAATEHPANPAAKDNTNHTNKTTPSSSDFTNLHSPTEGIGANTSIQQPTANSQHPSPITHHLILALYTSNGFAESRNANAVRMAEPMASRYAMAAESMKRGAPTPVIYMAGYEEREQHRQPFSVGLSVGIPIAQRWTLTTGLAYTQLHADFLKIMNKQRLAKEQDLQYVGCPVNINYRFLQTKRLRAYAAAGAQMDVNVKAKSATEGVETETPKDRPQFSTQAAVGLQFDVMPQVGLYVEPGMKYYFDNGSNVSTFFKDKPCNFNLQLGLRWNFE